MTFLSPGPALVAAAIALPLLLALYVLKLRRRQLRASTIAFWQAASADAQANVPFQRLRASWMLLLHLVLLSLLLLALARPVLESDGKDAPSRIVLLVDVSASMSAKDEVGITGDASKTRLERAKERAKEIVRESRRAAKLPAIAVVAVGAQSEVVLGFSTSAPMLDAAIDAIVPTDQPGDLLGALKLAQSLQAEMQATEANEGSEAGTEKSEGEEARASKLGLVLLSDGSFAGIADGAQAAGQSAETTAEGTLQRRQSVASLLQTMSLRFERVGPPVVAPAAAGSATVAVGGGTAARNVGIARIAAQRDAKTPSRVRLLLALVSNAPEETPVTVSIALDGVVKQRTAVVLPKATAAVDAAGEESAARASDSQKAEGADLKEAAGSSQEPRARAATRWAPGMQELVVDVADVSSGVLSVVLDAGGAPDALEADNTASVLLSPQRAPNLLVLRSPLASSESNTLRFLLTDVIEELAPAKLEVRVVKDAAEASEQIKANASWADVAVVDDLSLASAPAMPVIVLGGDVPALGVSSGGELRDWSGLVFWDRQHPLLQGVGLDSLVLGKRLQLVLATQESSDEAAKAWRHDVLARDGDDPLIVLAQPRRLADGAGTAHIITGFSLLESNWPLSPSFAIFLANTIDSLALRDASKVGRSLNTVTSGQVRVPATGEVKLVGPIERVLREKNDNVGDVGSAAVLVPTGVVPRAGLYSVESAQAEGVDRLVAVNLVDAHESAVAAPSELRFEGDRVAAKQAGTAQRELWPSLLLAALLVLTLEWVVFAKQTRA